MGLNALHHVTVKTNDLEATRDFYSEVLGLEVGFRPDLDFPGYWLYCGPIPVVHLVPRENGELVVDERASRVAEDLVAKTETALLFGALALLPGRARHVLVRRHGLDGRGGGGGRVRRGG